MEKYDASKEINKLLVSEKSSDEVEKESREILSRKLYDYKIAELKNELIFYGSRDPSMDIETIDRVTDNDELESNFDKFKENISKEDKLDFVQYLAKEFPKASFYLVGGMVRDGFLGKKSKDIDIVIQGINPQQLEEFLKKYGKVDLVGKNFGVYKFWKTKVAQDKNITDAFNVQQEVDIALPRKEKSTGSGKRSDFEVIPDHSLDIQEDLSRRDLTINAMAYNLLTGELIDPFEGKKDLLEGKIRCVGNAEERFREDYSRMLRAIRFAVKLGFSFDKETYASICKNSQKIVEKDKNNSQIVPWETIGEELKKSFCIDASRTLELLDKSSLLKHVLPEIEELKKYQQPKKYHPVGDVFTHTRLALKSLPADSSLTLIFATLFHDIGKSKTQKIDNTGKITFYEHAQEGAILAKNVCERLRFTKLSTEKIALLVRKHMQMHQIEKMSISKIYKLFMEELPREILRLGIADISGCLSKELDSIEFSKNKITEFITKKEESKPLIMGKDLIKLGLKQGKIFGIILEKLFEIQLIRKIVDKNQMMEIAREIIKNEFVLSNN